MPEINRFRRGYSLQKSRAYECLFRASSFAEFLTCMASLREGSRGGEVTAMGGWQWGSGMGPRIREDNAWVGGGFPLPSLRGEALRGGTGMGPRIREDNGGGMGSRFRLCGGGFSAEGRGWVPAYARTTGGGWVPASVFAGAGSPRGKGDGSPHTRGQRVGGGFSLPSLRGRAVRGGRGMDSRFRLCGGGFFVGGWGWVSASARTTGGGGFPLPSLRGQALHEGTGMGPRIREDTGGGRVLAFRPCGGRISTRGQRVGMAVG